MVFPDRWKLLQGSSGRYREVAQLPSDLLAETLLVVGGGKPPRLGGVGGCTQGVRAHMRDGSSLPGCPGGSDGSWTAHITSCATSDEAAADLFGDIKLATRKCTRPGDRLPRAAVVWSFGLEQRQDSFRAVCCPPGDNPTLGFAQCLRCHHTESLSGPAIAPVSGSATACTIPTGDDSVAAAAQALRVVNDPFRRGRRVRAPTAGYTHLAVAVGKRNAHVAVSQQR